MPISPTKYLDSAMKNSKQINIVCIISDGSKQSQQTLEERSNRNTYDRVSWSLQTHTTIK